MTSAEKKLIQKWVNTWEGASGALELVKTKDLQTSNYYERNRHILNDMLTYAVKHRKEKFSSGLVEQQRLFRLLWEKLELENGE